MSCRTTRQRLSAWIDDELGPPELLSVRSHLECCPVCARTAGHLRRLKRTAAELEDLDPPSDLLHRSLAALREQPERKRWFFATVAGAVAAAAGLAGVVFWTMSSEPAPSVKTMAPVASEMTVNPAVDEFQSAEKHYREAVQSLRQIAGRESARWSTARRERFQRDLGLFDRALGRSRAAAELSGVDPQAQELHLATYRQQVRFLQNAILRDVEGATPRPSPPSPMDGPPSQMDGVDALPAVWQP